MKKNKTNVITSKLYIRMYLHIFISLFIGSFIYLTWRSKEILIFYILYKLGLNDLVNSWRALFEHIDVPYFILYALPDLCWVYSFTIYIGIFSVKLFKKSLHYHILLFLPVFLGAGSEIGQLLNIVPGTFDIFDMIAYTGGYLLALLTLYLNKFIKKGTN